MRFILIMWFFIAAQKINAQQQISPGATITGVLDSSQLCDSVRLIFDEPDYNDFLPYPIKPLKLYRTAVVNGEFSFALPDSLNYPLHFRIDSNMRVSMSNSDAYLFGYILDREDNVHISIEKEELRFSGRGAEKYNCKYSMDTAANSERSRNLGMYQTITNSLLHDFYYNDSVINGTTYTTIRYERKFRDFNNRLKIVLAELDKYQSLLPSHIYQLIYVDLTTSWQNLFFSSFNSDIKRIDDSTKLENLRDLFNRLPAPERTISEPILLRSPSYLRYLWLKELREFYFSHKNFDYNEMYYRLKGKHSKVTNERLLTYHLNFVNSRLANNSESINDALNTQIKTDSYKKVLKELLKSKAGTRAYDFALPNLNGDTVRLSDFKGRAVFLDFYYRGCAPCRLYYQDIVSEVKKIYKDNPNIVFIAVSIDKKREDWIKGIESEEYSSFQAINVNTEGLGYDHKVIREYAVLGYPTPILIDKKGFVFNRTQADLRSNVESLKVLIDQVLDTDY